MDDEHVIEKALPEATLREWGLWLLRRRVRMRVTGDSMRPTLAAGDLVLVDPRAYAAGLPRPGEIAVARHPFRTDLVIIKRVAAVTPDGRIDLRSDNPHAGSDSRHFGPIAQERLRGRVTCRIPAVGNAD